MWRRRSDLLANGWAPSRFHSPADKIYGSGCVYESAQRAIAAAASRLLLCQVPLHCNYDKVKWLVFITRPALIHNECDMMAAGIPRIPRRWKIAERIVTTCAKKSTTCFKTLKPTLPDCVILHDQLDILLPAQNNWNYIYVLWHIYNWALYKIILFMNFLS